MILVNQIISAILQLMLFSAVPFLWYIVTHKKVCGFFDWLGIRTVSHPPVQGHGGNSYRISCRGCIAVFMAVLCG